uniref:RNA polymerase sigma factor n=1 Tax=Candidatus Scatousia sp. TaxID=3085663 RepID=UPI004028216F
MNFKEIIKKNRVNVKNIIRKISGEDNEDLEQEVYLKVWKNSDKYNETGNFRGWISTVAKNVAKDYLKSSARKREQLIAEDDKTFEYLKDTKTSPELNVLKNDRQKRILEAINSLKPKFREVIVYTEFYGYTYEDCAKKFHCPIGTIKSRIYNAKKGLAEELKDLL